MKEEKSTAWSSPRKWVDKEDKERNPRWSWSSGKQAKSFVEDKGWWQGEEIESQMTGSLHWRTRGWFVFRSMRLKRRRLFNPEIVTSIRSLFPSFTCTCLIVFLFYRNSLTHFVLWRKRKRNSVTGFVWSVGSHAWIAKRERQCILILDEDDGRRA